MSADETPPYGRADAGTATGTWLRWADPVQRRRLMPFLLLTAVSLLLQIPSLAIASHAHRPLVFWLALLAALSSFLLLSARLAPGPVVAALALLCTPAIAAVGGPPFAAVPLVFAVMLAIHAGTRIWVWASLAAVALVGGIGWYVVSRDPYVSVRVLIVVIVLCIVVGVAEAGRTRGERYRAISRDVAARRQTAAEAERLRIARELHDVLAHSLSQISVQAGVGLHLFDSQPERARESLGSIKATSGRALDEIRGVLGMLRGDGDPAARAPEPGLSRISELITTVGAAGLVVDVSGTLGDSVPMPTQFAVYRVVQEALTNVIRHSGARTANLALHAEAADYLIVVSDPGPAVGSEQGMGRGLIGMRERASALGGSVSAEKTSGGGFRVAARFPRGEER